MPILNQYRGNLEKNLPYHLRDIKPGAIIETGGLRLRFIKIDGRDLVGRNVANGKIMRVNPGDCMHIKTQSTLM